MNDSLHHDRAVERYMADIDRYPLLTREREAELAGRYRNAGDLEAGRQLVVSNLRFVVKVCLEYRGYRLDLLDLIQEGSIGLMMAVRKFDPARGFRLISYAVWWIRAFIHGFIMRSWSLVKLGTTQAQRRLFFRLRLARQRADREAGDNAPASLGLLAKQFAVAEADIADMEGRLAARDFSLDAPVQDDAHQLRVDLLSSCEASQEELLGQMEERQHVRGSVFQTVGSLSAREHYIVENRLMAEEPKTLQEIGERFQISRERVRQIQGTVLGKIRAALTEEGGLSVARSGHALSSARVAPHLLAVS
jgi:RNA polymerase sigma-32 factor